MIKETIILIITLYFLALLQTSFTVFLNFYGFTLNLILISVILINIFESSEGKIGFISAFIGGFLLDIWSSHIFGFWIFLCFLTAIFIKLIIKKYVRIPEIKKIFS